MHDDKQVSKILPQYIHFQKDCLKKYARRKLANDYEEFPFELIKIDDKAYTQFLIKTKAYLLSYGVPHREKFYKPYLPYLGRPSGNLLRDKF